MAVALVASAPVMAQQVNTLYFLENAPMRHTINPALQPISDGYVLFSPLGFISASSGNNSLTLSDLVYKNPNDPSKYITPFHPDGDRNRLMSRLRKVTTINGDIDMNFLSFGKRTRSGNGFWHVGIRMREESNGSLPKGFFHLVDNGVEPSLTDVQHYNLNGLGAGATFYTQIGGGYSHNINEHWTVGGKVNFLLGTGYARTANLKLDAYTSANAVGLDGSSDVFIAAPLNLSVLDNVSLADIDFKQLVNLPIYKILRPAGYGASIDLGVSYKPIPQVQISAALTDLGFIVWRGKHYPSTISGLYTGVGDIVYGDTGDLGNRITDALKAIVEDFVLGQSKQDIFARSLSTRLNIGVDANFLDNLLGVGVLSSTRYYYGQVLQEVTLGGTLRPCNWFNMAITYSLINNGKYSDIGAGFSIMPYDGINLTLAADYIPTSYTAHGYPYKSKGVNLAFGISFTWGTNRRDSDHDGVYDKLDMCPNTPKGVRVDALGCPIDSDGDGVPDYKDLCPGTEVAAYGLTDEHGCPRDSDGDGVPDYKDECPNTPREAAGMVDEKGCELDTDGDGVPDWKDRCPNTLPEARAFVDSLGCDRDSDGDFVPDYKDECPDTPAEARRYVDEKGCPFDSDGDGVPDYKDLAPGTPAEARGFVDEYGRELDTDGDGVPDWKDMCPTIAGPAVNKGCPEVKKEVRNLLNKAMQGIEFETGKASIKKSSYGILDEIAKTFISNPDFVIEIQGHTDNTGSETLNLELSDKRAKAVREYLVSKGVSGEHVTAKGYGSSRPIADNSTKAGRQKNRRVEFDITFEEVRTEVIYEHLDEEVQQILDTHKATKE